MIAIAIALFFGYLLKFIAKYNKKTAARLVIFLSFVIILLLIGYVALIKMDAFELLEKAGINTSGRVEIYNAVDEFYDFTPSFLGNGIGFLTYQLNTFMNVGVASVHNDFLQHFIRLNVSGFPGHPLKGNVVIGIAVRDLAVCRIFIVIFRGNCRFPAHFLKHFQVRNMKLHHMGFDNCGYKKHLFLLHGFFPPGNVFCKKWT
jgi:energy-coupling factor transporter transmembrane protein EcfT